MHSNKPATQVHYIKQMPDIEILMEQMSPFLEDKLNEVNNTINKDFASF